MFEGTVSPHTVRGDFSKLAPALVAQIGHLPNFVIWRWHLDEVRQNWTKPPFNARQPSWHASPTNEATWSTLDEAIAAARGADGIGFMVTRVKDLVGIDLDHCRNPVTGEVKPWAKTILDEAAALGAYVEVSVSGTGFHIVGRATGLPAMDNNWPVEDDGKIEVYHQPRPYLTISGAQHGTCADVLPTSRGSSRSWSATSSSPRGRRTGRPRTSSPKAPR